MPDITKGSFQNSTDRLSGKGEIIEDKDLRKMLFEEQKELLALRKRI